MRWFGCIVLAAASLIAPSALAQGAPGGVFRDCPDCPEMVTVPAGAFTMGSPASEAGRYPNEGPQRRVTIAAPFAIGKFEVTFAEWEACVADQGCKHRADNDGWGRGRRPVMNVSWDDAQRYVAWLSAKSGKRYRLPSEAEWEYAARAGTTTAFSTGMTISTDQANYNGTYVYGAGKPGEYRRQTVPVGSFAPNAFGLHDMHGNVEEWVEDCFNRSYERAPADGTAWLSGDCSRRIVRGGAWNHDPAGLRSAGRNVHPPGLDTDFGFRVARSQ